MSNPFEETEAWDVSTDRYLGEGNHLVRIEEAEDSTSNQGNPMIILVMKDRSGALAKERMGYHGGFLDKVVGLYKSCGLSLPKEGEFDPGDNCRLTAAKIKQLVGKQVGAVIRNEPDRDKPGKFWPRVKGFVEPSRIADAGATNGFGDQDVPIDSEFAATGASSQPMADEDIPFKREELPSEFAAWHGHENR